MDQHRIYEDLPLKDDVFSTRLLTIRPGSGDDPLVCRLRSVNINANTKYDALSYTWGDHNDKRMITVNAEPFSVTANLEDALRALRLSDHPRKLWVDAMCINQADSREKAMQIPGMGQIYRHAHLVIIWLGRGDKDTDCAIRVANAISDTPRTHLPVYLGSKDRRARLQVRSLFYADPRHTLHLEQISFSQGLDDLLLRPWWTRVWVVQEFAMSSSDPSILCGNASVPWRMFLRFIELYHPFKPGSGISELLIDAAHVSSVYERLAPNEYNESSIIEPLSPKDYEDSALKKRWDKPYELEYMRWRVRQPPSLRNHSAIRDNLTLLEDDFLWIGSIWAFEAHDPRDKFYGLLGLTRSPFGKRIKIDYSIPVDDFVKDIMHTEVEIHRSLDLLILCNPFEGQSSPSWLPDLYSPGVAGLPAVRQTTQNGDPFNRYIESKLRITEEITNGQCYRLDWESRLLRSTGTCIGIVKHISGHEGDVIQTLIDKSFDGVPEWEILQDFSLQTESESIKSLVAAYDRMHTFNGLTMGTIEALSRNAIDIPRISLTALDPPGAETLFADFYHMKEASRLSRGAIEMLCKGAIEIIRIYLTALDPPGAETLFADNSHTNEISRLSNITNEILGKVDIEIPEAHSLYLKILRHTILQAIPWLKEEKKAAILCFYWAPLWTRLRKTLNTAGDAEEQGIQSEQPRTMTPSEQYNVKVAAGEERVWFTTDTGLIGLGPLGMEVNDEAVMFHASPFAFVLRAKDSKHRLIGQALVCPPRQIPPPYEIPGVDHPMDYPRRWREPILRTFVLE